MAQQIIIQGEFFMDKAGFFSRFFAWLLDGIAVVVLPSIFGCCFGGIFFFLGTNSDSNFLSVITGIAALMLIFILFLFQFFYFGYFWSQSGQSLGMKMLSMKVVRRNNEEMTFIRSALRGTLGYYISGFVFSLGYIWAAFDANNETWHDKIFDTWVVSA
jgi:uncharacterized RDD family membrane protein YckC